MRVNELVHPGEYNTLCYMKIHSRILTASVVLVSLVLSGCGQSEKKSATAAPANAKTATVATVAKPTDGRAVAITGNDLMKFNVTEIRAKAGEGLAVTLTNEGTVPKFSMGHNWVLLAADTDVDAFVAATSSAAATDYVPPEFADKVLAATKLLGPKEADTASFYAPKTPGQYVFLCSFPGHYQVGMHGVLIVE